MKGVSCFNGGFAVQMGGFIFTCGGRRGAHAGASVLVGGGVSKKIIR